MVVGVESLRLCFRLHRQSVILYVAVALSLVGVCLFHSLELQPLQVLL